MKVEAGKRYLLEDGTVTGPFSVYEVIVGYDAIAINGKRILAPLDEWVPAKGDEILPSHTAVEWDLARNCYRIPSSQFAEQGEVQEDVIGKAMGRALLQSVKLLKPANPANPAPREPATSEPAVSDAAYEAHWGERAIVTHAEVEATFSRTGVVLRTRQEWETAKRSADANLTGELEAKDAEVAALRENVDTLLAQKTVLLRAAELRKDIYAQLQAELERLRKKENIILG